MIIVGTGGMARRHISRMISRRDTEIAGCVEVSAKSQKTASELFEDAGKKSPPFFSSIRELSKALGPIDASFICTPHKFHYGDIRDCLNLGMDVLVEKPMVIGTADARRVIRLRDKLKKTVVVGFPGSLSPGVRKGVDMIRQGKLGRVSAINAFVHQDWKQITRGTWRQDPEISGGGFVFDTGSHMVNTVIDLAGADVAELAAVADNRKTPVDIVAGISGRFRNDIFFSMTAVGDAFSCESKITVIGDKGLLEVCIWGSFLRFRPKTSGEFKDVAFPKYAGVWDQFLKIRSGRQENSSPAEKGLRFSEFMTMMRKSVETGRTVRS
jgi:predicted dehydrogenase